MSKCKEIKKTAIRYENIALSILTPPLSPCIFTTLFLFFVEIRKFSVYNKIKMVVNEVEYEKL